MPITDPKLRQRLIDDGYDPDLSQLASEQPQPVNNPTPAAMQTTNGPSAIGAGFREFARSAPATVAGLAAFPKGAAIGAPLGPVGAAATGIGSSIVAGLLTRMAQDKVIGSVAPSYIESMQQDAQAQPIATALGGLASGGIAMKPDLKAVAGAGRALRDLALQKTIHPATRVAAADAGNLANVGLGAAVPTAVEYGQQAYAQGTLTPDVDARTMLINALGGALISNPNKLGQKMGLTPNTYRTYATDGLAAAHPASPKLGLLPPSEADIQYQNELVQTPEYQAFRAKQAEVEAKKKLLADLKALKTQDYEATQQINKELAVEQMDKQRLADRSQYEQKIEEDVSYKELAQDKQLPKLAGQVEDSLTANLLTKPEVKPKPAVVTEQGKEIYPDYTGNQEIDATVNEKVPLSEAEQIQDDYDRGIRKSKNANEDKINQIRQNLGITIDEAQKLIQAKDSVERALLVEEFLWNKRQMSRLGSSAHGDAVEQAIQEAVNTTEKIIGTRKSKESSEQSPITYRGSFDAGNGKKLHIWDLTEDVKDTQGNIIHPKGSTISEPTLQRLGIPYEIPANKKSKQSVTDALYDKHMELGRKLALLQDELESPYVEPRRRHRIQQEIESIEKRLESVLPPTKMEDGNVQFDNRNQKGALDNKPSEASAAAMDKLAASRGVKIERPNEVIADGESVAGITDLNTREAQISRTKGGLDSDPHEIQHNFFNDMLTRGTPAEKKLGQKALDTVQASEEYKQWRSEGEYKELSDDLAVEEFLTTETGIDFVRRVFKTDGNSDLKNFFKDVGSMIRERRGKASVADMTRLQSRKLAYDPPASETFDKAGIGQNVGAGVDTETTVTPEPNIKKSISSEQKETSKSTKTSGISRLLKSDIDKIKEKGEAGKIFGDTAEAFLEKRTENIGEYTTPMLQELRAAVPIDYSKPSEAAKQIWHNDNPVFQRVVNYFDAIHDKETPNKLGAAEQKVADIVRKHLAKVFEARNSREGLHQGEANPDYLPQMPNKVTIDRFKNPAEHKKLQNELVAYYKKLGRSADEAKENFNELIAGYSKQEVDSAEQFGPLDKAHGVGLPKQWREQSLMARLNRYMDRTGRRFAFYDTFDQLENKDEILNSVKVDDNAKAILREIHGTSVFHEPEINAITGLVKSFMLGPITGAVDLTASHSLGMQHHQNPAQTVKAWLNSWKNIKQGWTDAYKTGRNRMNFNALEWDEANDITDGIRRLRDLVGTAGGRNIMEKISRARVMSEGRYLATDYAARAQDGKLSAQGHKFFNDFAKGIDWKGGKLTEADILKIAARYVDSVQGTYDPRGTDYRVREGSLGPYLSLSRWSIEKLNNFNKHVIQEVPKGNWTPLLMSTLGMFIGGSAVNQVREMLSKRKQKTATWEELAAAKSEGEDIAPDVVYKLAALASASAYAGMLGDLTKSLLDAGYARNKPQTPNNVLIDAAGNIASTVVSGFKGAQDNGITPELFIDIVAKAAEDNIQAYRVALAHLSGAKSEDIERANKLRDLRTYNLIADNPISDLTGDFVTPLGKGDKKKFKQTKDIGEAAELVPGLIEDAIKKAKGNPDLLKKNLTALKQNSYQTLPNPDTMPTTFLSYITYLEKSQGSQAATARLQDYLERNAVNKAKAEMIP